MKLLFRWEGIKDKGGVVNQESKHNQEPGKEKTQALNFLNE